MPDLKGKRILITREAKQTKFFSEKVRASGGIPIEVPLLKIASNKARNREVIFTKLSGYDWIIFTSANGVHYFFEQLPEELILLVRKMKLAVVGHKTEEALKQYHLSAHLVPEVYDANSLAEIFLEKYQAGESILLVRGNLSRDVLPSVFEKKGIGFDAIEVYETQMNKENAAMLKKVIAEEALDFITFTSPSTVEAFVKLSEGCTSFPCVCIGTTTKRAAENHGFTLILTAETFTIEGMIEVMSKHI
ncbi:uroporphyrinogen-III synthase [Ralstonia pickettii]|nr:uroporphyrinogen-III synthase [Ralstonia pickettii]